MIGKEEERTTASNDQSDPNKGSVTLPQDPSSIDSDSEAGVQIPVLLQQLFGLDFLPRQTLIVPPNDQHKDSADASTAGYERSYLQGHENLAVSLEIAQDDTSRLTSSDVESDEDEMKSPRRVRRGQRIKNVYNVLKTRVTETKARRLSRQPTKELPVRKGLHEDWTKAEQANLERYKQNLASVEMEVMHVQSQVQEISSRIRFSKQEIVDLENQLFQATKRLHDDVAALDNVKNDLTRLEQRRVETVEDLNGTAQFIWKSLQENDSPSCPVSQTSGRPPVIPRTLKVRNVEKMGISNSDPPSSRHALQPCRSSEELVTSKQLKSLEVNYNSETNHVRRRSASSPDLKGELRRVQSSFIRAHDLCIIDTESGNLDSNSELSSSSGLTRPDQRRNSSDVFFSIDQGVGSVLDALFRYGYEIITDESERFRPLQNTMRILSKTAGQAPPESWPVKPWHMTSGSEVLVWQGSSPQCGPGKDLPVTKARGIVRSTPELVMNLLLDSSRVSEYNKMSKGRKDLLFLQKGLHTSASDSDYGIAGEAKIVQALNKPPLIKRNIEMLTLIYARTLPDNSPLKSYICVSRSVWEDETGQAKTSTESIRSEMLLGVSLLRAIEDGNGVCHTEITTITHVQTSAVPEALSTRMAPNQAVAYIKEIQSVFA